MRGDLNHRGYCRGGSIRGRGGKEVATSKRGVGLGEATFRTQVSQKVHVECHEPEKIRGDDQLAWTSGWLGKGRESRHVGEPRTGKRGKRGGGGGGGSEGKKKKERGYTWGRYWGQTQKKIQNTLARELI